MRTLYPLYIPENSATKPSVKGFFVFRFSVFFLFFFLIYLSLYSFFFNIFDYQFTFVFSFFFFFFFFFCLFTFEPHDLLPPPPPSALLCPLAKTKPPNTRLVLDNLLSRQAFKSSRNSSCLHSVREPVCRP